MIQNFIAEASRVLPIFWPLQSFIATNPLWDLHDHSFQEAIVKLKKFSPTQGAMPLKFYQNRYYDGKILDRDVFQAMMESEEEIQHIMNDLFSNVSSNDNKKYTASNENIVSNIERKILDFLMLYFDRNQENIVFLEKNGLYECWFAFVSENNSHLHTLVKKLPTSKDMAITQLFVDLNVSLENQTDYLSRIYFQILGWSSLIKWLEQRPENPFIKVQASLLDVALIWLCYEKYYVVKEDVCYLKYEETSIQTDKIKSLLIWQRAYEIVYERELHQKLQNKKNIKKSKDLSAQAVFCIDTRSEGIRRHLEKNGHYETYGFAGFFGFFFKYQKSNEPCDVLQCPALFSPQIQLFSESQPDWMCIQSNNFLNALHDTKKLLFSPFGFVEITGIWYGFVMLLKSIFPEKFQKFKKWLGLDRQEKILNATLTSSQVNNAFYLESRVNNSVQFLKTIGLTKNFAPLVLICGHGAETENNPYQSSLDCGACGGNSGYANAIVVCQILNDREVRQALKSENIEIPETTYFIAGFHNTTRDEFTFYKKDIPQSHNKFLSKLDTDLRIAGSSLREERMQDMPGHFSVNNRSTHWAELMPEMGLIKNAALIIGPRDLTEHVSLDRRVFLHSYDPNNDPDGKLLTGILFGPLIVAHWINAQYYFSTTDPTIYGSGNKMLHNVVSGLGVMEGNFSDLKIGLPWQSVAFRDEILHEPLRLLVVIYAPKLLVEALLSQHPTIKALFTGQWAHLKIIEPR
jgi:uncharacterized protein